MDHAPLCWIQHFKEPKGQVARWLEQLQEFDFRIEHQRGKQHNNADVLPRIPCSQCGLDHPSPETSVCVCSSSDATDWPPKWSRPELQESQQKDPTIEIVLARMQQANTQPTLAAVAGTDRTARTLWTQWD